MGLLLAPAVHFPQWPPVATYQRTDPPLVARRASLPQDQSPMHLQSPRTLESVAVMHMCLVINSFRSRASSDSYRSVNTAPIGKNSNAKRWFIEGYAERATFVVPTLHSTRKGAIVAPRLDKYCQPAIGIEQSIWILTHAGLLS